MYCTNQMYNTIVNDDQQDASHPIYQLAAIPVDNDCKYSYVLLIMGKDVSRNM